MTDAVSARPLAGKVALVTGSSRGIGRAILLELARQGADGVVNFFRHGAAGEATAAEVRSQGARAIAVRAHVGRPAEVAALFDAARQAYGGIDILICSAASSVFRPLLAVDQQGWDWTMDISVRSVLLCAQHATPMMEARGQGRIVTIGSAWSARVQPNYGMAGIAKGALESLTRYLAVELAPRGIAVNAVAPGAIRTDAWNTYLAATGEDLESATIRRTPTGKLVSAEQIARVVAFLCTVEGVVGQTIVVDNGYSIAG